MTRWDVALGGYSPGLRKESHLHERSGTKSDDEINDGEGVHELDIHIVIHSIDEK